MGQVPNVTRTLGGEIKITACRSSGHMSMVGDLIHFGKLIPCHEVDTDGIYVHFEVQSFDADGNVVNTSFAVGNFADWPDSFKNDVQSVYSVLTNYATSLGLIAGPGSDDPIG